MNHFQLILSTVLIFLIGLESHVNPNKIKSGLSGEKGQLTEEKGWGHPGPDCSHDNDDWSSFTDDDNPSKHGCQRGAREIQDYLTESCRGCDGENDPYSADTQCPGFCQYLDLYIDEFILRQNCPGSCNHDKKCPPEKPICRHNKCEPCNPNCKNDCGPGLLCTVDGTCVQCIDDTNCLNSLQPSCNTTSGTCVCTFCSCSLAGLICNAAGNCVQCITNADCPADNPQCDLRTGNCTNCLCDPNVCKELPLTNLCSSTGVCVECNPTVCPESQCPAGSDVPVCDPNSGLCRGCESDEECPEGDSCDTDSDSPTFGECQLTPITTTTIVPD